MNNLAVITARSGSKGLKNKNIKLINNKPLLAFSIEAALKSEMFDIVHVSTDSEEYASIAREYGAEVPFLRSKELSEDHSDSWEVLRFTVERYKRLGKEFDTVTLLQPTSPLRTGYDIRKAFEIYTVKHADNVFSVSETESKPFFCNTIPANGSLYNFISQDRDGRRQDSPVYYCLNGAIYIVSTKVLMERGSLYGESAYAYIMPKIRSIDIDDEIDFRLAEILLKEFEKE